MYGNRFYCRPHHASSGDEEMDDENRPTTHGIARGMLIASIAIVVMAIGLIVLVVKSC